MIEMLEAVGAKGGYKWDDGSDHHGVAKIYVQGGLRGVQSIQFDYVDKDGQLKGGELYGVSDIGFTHTFEINYLNNEHLESVEVYHDAKSGFIQGIQFKTTFRVSELIGYDRGTKFLLAVEGKKIVGFYGYMMLTDCNSLGAYFTRIPATRLEVKGCKGGKEWDDGPENDGIRKIYVHGDREGIQSIKVDYVKSEDQKDDGYDPPGGGFTQSFEINHLDNEHLIAVDGYYDDSYGVIQGLEFKTNMRTSKLIGYDTGKKFSLAANGQEIVGFHGYAEDNLNSLGAYFKTASVTKSERHGSIGTKSWDDGVFDSIRKVYVTYDKHCLTCIKFDYNNGNTVVRRIHGLNMGQEKKFELNPDEFIISLEGTLKYLSDTYTMLTSLTFRTSKGRIFATCGDLVSDNNLVGFVLESKGCALVGFHGRENGRTVTAIGAYYYPLPLPTGAEKLEAQGGDRGASWDDGVFDGVRKICVGKSKSDGVVAYLKFVYDKNTHVVIGDDHGNKTLTEMEEFEIEYPSEYITSVEGCYDKVDGSEVQVITMLRFKTNRRTSITFGFESTSNFELHKECHKIVGFHGKASNMIHQLGVYVVPISH